MYPNFLQYIAYVRLNLFTERLEQFYKLCKALLQNNFIVIIIIIWFTIIRFRHSETKTNKKLVNFWNFLFFAFIYGSGESFLD